MNPQEMQQPNQSADKSAAALSFATMLSEQLMKAQNPMQEGQESMQKGQKPVQKDQKESKMEGMDEMKEMIKEAIRSELSPIKEAVQKALDAEE